MNEREYNFDGVLKVYSRRINSLYETLNLVMYSQIGHLKGTKNKFERFTKEHVVKKGTGEKSTLLVKPEYHRDWIALINEYQNANIAVKFVPESFFVSLVTQFDLFFGDIIRTIYYQKPEAFQAGDRKIKYSEIVKMTAIDDVKKFLIDEEIDSLLRNNHTEFFKHLNNKVHIDFEKWDGWSEFIEITERRNLFVHCDGKVTKQYLEVCRKNGVSTEDVVLGDSLSVNADYFRKAHHCLYTLGVTLTHMVWRKLLPTNLSMSDNDLNRILFELLCIGNYELGKKIGDFAATLVKFSSEEYRLIMMINRAQAYKWSGNENKCQEILGSTDWSASKNKFQLAKQVLSDDFENAIVTICKIGRDEEMQIGYQSWPLFQELVKYDKFSETYEDIFGESFRMTDDREIDAIDEVAVTEEDC